MPKTSFLFPVPCPNRQLIQQALFTNLMAIVFTCSLNSRLITFAIEVSQKSIICYNC
ncbi:MAG: hypothetical protein ACK57T_02265 [Dolichospermum sp.]